MSKQIDQRVVEMRFDNKQFESATKATLGTLQKLKEALNLSNSGKALEELAKTSKEIDIAGIAAGVEALNKRFSTLGIVGMQVIKNITNGLMNTLAKGIKFVDDAIVSGGIKRAMNLENARFQLQSIIKDEIRVAEVMKVANDSVDGTAYSFDVAAKAASQFTASGITDMDRMAEALRGMAGVTATFNADYEQMSMIFTQVAGQGRLMGDQLLQLSTRGANAAATIAEFVNGVTDGSIEARGEVTSTIKAITQGAKVTEGDIREFVSKGKINFDIFASAMSYAFGDSAKEANKTFNGALANMKAALARIGAGFFSPLIEQESAMVRLFNALRLRINDVKKSLVFDEALGNVHALSKQVTDSILALADGAAKYFETIDISEHMSTFYYWVEIIKNGAKGIVSVLKPVGQAFKEVFLNFSIIDFKNVSVQIHAFTKSLKLSERGSKDLKDAFKGVFSIGKLLIDIFVGLLKSITPINKPVAGLGSVFLSLVGSLGRVLSSFSEWVRESKVISLAFEGLQRAVLAVSDVISYMIKGVGGLVDYISGLKVFEAILSLIVGVFIQLGKIADPILKSIGDAVKDFSDRMATIIPKKAKELIEKITESISKLDKKIRGINLANPTKMFKDFGDALKGMFDGIGENSKGDAFITNIKEFFSTLKESLSIDESLSKIDKFKTVMGGFVDWIKTNLIPIFGDLSIGGVAAGAMSGGLIYSIVKMAQSIENATQSISSIPDTLGSVRNVLKAYGEELKSREIMNVAKAIALLAGALVVLSMVDSDKLWRAAEALALVSGVFLIGGGKLLDAMKGLREASNVTFEVAKRVGTALNSLAKALKWKAIGGVVKSFGTSIALIAGSLIALALMYKNDKEALLGAADILKDIAIAIVAVMGVGSLIGSSLSRGMYAFKAASDGVKSLSTSLLLIVASLSLLMKMEIPSNWPLRLGIFVIVFAALAGVAVALTAAGSVAGSGKVASGPILAMSVALLLIVESLKKLMKMELSSDWPAKLGILVVIMGALAGVIVAIGYAGSLSEKNMKVTASIFAMCVYIGAITAALMVLSVVPWGKLLKGTIALGALMLALGLSLKQASEVSDTGVAKTVLAMALMVGSITAALSILSIIPLELLVKSAAVLGVMLLALAKDLEAAGKVSDKGAAKAVLAMCLEIAAITAALVVLSTQPWENLLAAGASLSAVLLALASAFKIMSAIEVDLNLLGTILGGILALIGVAGAIAILANQPWENLLAAGTALSMTMLSMASALAIVSTVGAVVPAAMAGILAFDAFIANLVLVLAVLGALAKSDDFVTIMGKGGEMLIGLGDVLGRFVGSIIKGLAEEVMSSLPNIAKSLSDMADNLKPFISGMKQIDQAVLDGALRLVEVVLAITGANFIQGITKWVTGGNDLETFSQRLIPFGENLKRFADIVKGMDPSAVMGAAIITSIMSELANNLPDTGGLKAFILGDNDIAVFGEKLVEFGKHLKKFADIVKGIDASSVAGASAAGKMMVELANTIPKTGGLQALFTGDNSLDGFGEKLVSFGKSLKEYSDSVSDINLVQLAGVVTAFKSLIDASTMVASIDTSALGKFAKALKEMSNNAIQEFVSGFQNGTERVRKAIDVGVEGWAKSIKSNEKTIAEAAKKLIEAMVEKVNATIKAEFQTVVKGMNALGKQIIEALDKGVRSNVGKLKETGALMGKTFNEGYRESLDYRSPPHVIYEQAAQIGTAMINGVDSKLPLVEEAGKKLGTTMQKSISEGFQVDKSYEVYGDSLLKPIENVVAKTDTLTKKMQNSNVERTKLTKQGTKAAKAVHQEAIQEEKDYWEKLLEAKRQGLEAEKYMEMSIQDFRKEVLEGAKDALQNYMDQLDSTRDSIMGQMSLFDEVEEQEYKTKEELIQNLNDQIDAYQEYVDLLTSLNERLGADSSLGEYLRQLGVDSLDQLREINTMTDSELSNYAMLYDDKLALANQAAIQQLTTLQADTEAQLANLFGGMSSAVDLFDFAAIFDGSIESITKYVNDIMVPLQNAQIEAETASQAIAKAVAAGLADESAFSDAEGNMKEKLQALIDNIKADKEASATDAGKEIGGNLTEGVSEGIVEDTSTITDKANELMDLVEQAMKEAGEIHSPSMRSNREIGQPITSGIGVGMIENAQEAENAGKELITRILEAMKTMTTDLGTTTTTLVQTMTTAIQNEQGNFSDRGVESLRSFIGGIRDTFDELENATNAWVQLMMTIFHDRKEEYFDKGVLHALRYVAGMDSEHDSANRAGTDFTNVALKAIEALADEFRVAGEHAGQGFVNGILSKVEAARQAARELAAAAHEAAKSELDEASPSKKLFKIGDYGGIGFVNGLMANISKAHYAGKALAEEAGDSAFSSARNLSKVIDGALDLDPVIRPQIDLSDVNRSAQTIDRLFNEAIKEAGIKADMAALGMSVRNRTNEVPVVAKSSEEDGKKVEISLTQINQSPKALSRIEIYRQTKNLLSSAKGFADK